jgi:hypothetical protein
VPAIQVRRRHLSDKELRTSGTRSGVSHAKFAWPVERQRRIELIRDLIGPACARAEGVARLNHEAGNYAVKNKSVVQRLFDLLPGSGIHPFLASEREVDKILYGNRRLFFI